MLTISPSVKVFLVAGVTDMRKSFDTLAAIVSGTLLEDPYSGFLYVFCNRKRDRLKILFWQKSGFWLYARRLEKGTFAWPETSQPTIEMTTEELTLLLGGIDLRDTTHRRWYERPRERNKDTSETSQYSS